MKNSSLIVDVFLSALAGVGMWAAFPSLSLWWLIFPSLAIYFSRVDHSTLSRGLLNTVVFGFSWWLPLIHWVTLATGGYLPWVALATTQVIALCLWAVIARLSQSIPVVNSPLGQPFVYALTWVGVEQLRSHYPWTGFPWGNVAMPQVDSPLGQLAPWGGEVVVSFVSVALAVTLRRVFYFRSDLGDEHWFTRPALLVGSFGVFFVAWMIPLPLSQEAGTIRVGVVQGDVELPGAHTFGIEGKVTTNNSVMTRELVAQSDPVDLLIWGETGADRDPRESGLVAQLVDSSATLAHAPLLFGFANVKDDKRWNWLGVWYGSEGLDEESLYAKQKPVPFGEFIPFRSLISKLATQAAQINMDMAAAENLALMNVHLNDSRTIPIAIGICFESAYPAVIGPGVMAGGQLIVTPSNNYHFQSSSESAQQNQLLRFRAMEYSRSAIQASTTGMSSVILPDGRMKATTDPQSAAWLADSVPLRTSITKSAELGELPAQVVMGATGVYGVFALLYASIQAVVNWNSLRRQNRL